MTGIAEHERRSGARSAAAPADVIVLEESDLQERFHAEGWSDGLPVVAPTPDRVDAMLAAARLDPDLVVGIVPQRDRVVTAEKVAVNAVMAGCRPEYFPLVVTAMGAILQPAFNAHTVITSTGGAALCLVVSGTEADRLGMNAAHNVLGSGNRANATIGRAVRLVARNVLGASSPGLDGSSFGHPGKYSLCIAEAPPPAGWEPLRVELGFSADDSTVTVAPTEGPWQIANHLSPAARDILLTFAAAIRCPVTFSVGKGGHEVVVLFGPEHAQAVAAEGWTRSDVCEFLVAHTRVTPEELAAAGVHLEVGAQHDMTPDADGRLATLASPASVYVVTCGGAGAGWSAYLPTWAPSIHARAVTLRIPRPHERWPCTDVHGRTIDWLVFAPPSAPQPPRRLQHVHDPTRAAFA